MPLPFLAQLAALLAIQGGKMATQKYLGSRQQKKDDRAAAMRAVQGAMGQQGPPQAPTQPGMNPFDLTDVDERMQQRVFDQLFAKLLGPDGPGGATGSV